MWVDSRDSSSEGLEMAMEDRVKRKTMLQRNRWTTDGYSSGGSHRRSPIFNVIALLLLSFWMHGAIPCADALFGLVFRECSEVGWCSWSGVCCE